MTRKRKFLKFIKWGVIIFFILTLFILAAVLGFWQRVLKETPGAKELLAYQSAETSVIYDRTGEHKLYEVYGAENRKILTHEEIPEIVRKLTLTAEDNNFYNHHGFDIPSIIRAGLADLKAREYEQGASTITQQLARNIFLSRERTWKRKVKEIAIATKIEKEFSKEEILDWYLNQIPYGADIYGIEAASQNFFRKSAQELSLGEAATLAALPKAPTFYSPYGQNKEALLKRQQYILDRMMELNWGDKKEVMLAKSQAIQIYRPKTPIQAPHFVFYVLNELEKKYGEGFIKRGGLKIYTSLDYALQKKAENIVANRVINNAKLYGAENLALVAINPKNGEVLAMVGSKDFFSNEIDGEVNVATSRRHPGSAFKPIAYAKAFEKGHQPETLLFDVPTNFGPDGSGKDYQPNNYNGQFKGLVSLRNSLAMSLNVPAVKTLYLAGVKETIDLAERLGITTLTRKGVYGLSLVLGGGEVNLLELTGAYSVFANDGERNPIDPILKITNRQGEEIRYAKKKVVRVIDVQVARKINSILSDNKARTPVFGKNNSLFISGYQVAAKTGTTQEYRDAWTVGYTPNLAVGVWGGNNDNRPMKQGAAGIFVAAPTWKKFMQEGLLMLGDKDKFINYERNSGISLKTAQDIPGKKKVIYFSRETGEQISFNEAMHLAQDLVRKEVIFDYKGTASIMRSKMVPIELASQYAQDKMIQRWKTSLSKTKKYKEYKKEQKDKKKKKKKKKK